MNVSSRMKPFVVLAALVIGISSFLPYLSISLFGSTLSRSLMDGGDGIFVIIVAAIAMICAAMDKYKASLVMGVVALALFLFENSHVQSLLSSSTNDDALATSLARSMLQNGAGYYGLLIGAIALMLFSFLALNDK